MPRAILTEQLIQAPPDKVWAVLTNFKTYADWNPFIKKLHVPGEFKVGERIEVLIHPVGKRPATFKPKLLVVDPIKHELRWRGALPIPGLFAGTHYFQIQPEQGGAACKLIHGEDFQGLLVPLAGGMIAAAEQGFKDMNLAIKARAESPASS